MTISSQIGIIGFPNFCRLWFRTIVRIVRLLVWLLNFIEKPILEVFIIIMLLFGDRINNSLALFCEMFAGFVTRYKVTRYAYAVGLWWEFITGRHRGKGDIVNRIPVCL